MHHLSEEVLPEKAEDGDYPVRFDHCFKRIAFDRATQAKWDTVVNRPFYENATSRQMKKAVKALKEMARSPARARELNKASLRYRR
jgi:hypothetical protein